MADVDFRSFQKEVVNLGFYSYDEQQSLFDLARRCARTTGLSLGVAGAAGTAALGPGAVMGFLAGLATGTAACTAGSMLYKEQIKELLAESR